MAAPWETGWYWLAPGQSGEYWVSWGDTPQGLQFIIADPRGGGQSVMYTVSLGIRSIAQFGVPPKYSYWLTVINNGPDGQNFVLKGTRVDT
jgi:hypothetical protein